jgi:hypothetical protein
VVFILRQAFETPEPLNFVVAPGGLKNLPFLRQEARPIGNNANQLWKPNEERLRIMPDLHLLKLQRNTLDIGELSTPFRNFAHVLWRGPRPAAPRISDVSSKTSVETSLDAAGQGARATLLCFMKRCTKQSMRESPKARRHGALLDRCLPGSGKVSEQETDQGSLRDRAWLSVFVRHEYATVNQRDGAGLGGGYLLNSRPDNRPVDRGHNQNGKGAARQLLPALHILVAGNEHFKAFAQGKQRAVLDTASWPGRNGATLRGTSFVKKDPQGCA